MASNISRYVGSQTPWLSRVGQGHCLMEPPARGWVTITQPEKKKKKKTSRELGQRLW